MNIVNLVNKQNGDIGYKITRYPDSQQSIILSKPKFPLVMSDSVMIKARFCEWKDYELIACTVAALRRMGYEKIDLYVPYILGGRSDRDFTKGEGGLSYLIDVVKPSLELLNFRRIIVMDNHSDVMLSIKNSIAQDNSDLLEFALGDINSKNYCIVTPDSGAEKKIFDLIKGTDKELIVASKHRDPSTGKFLGFSVPILSTQLEKDLIWVDDICDGGGTFIGEVEEVVKAGHTGERYLVVTHGIFSQGFTNLSKYFDRIYCTNSFSGVGDISGNGMERTNVIQLNVFN